MIGSYAKMNIRNMQESVAQITGRTGLLAVIGSPVAHSLSPAMHNLSLQMCGIDMVYLAFDITKEQVPEMMRAVRTLGMRGCNVTMPDKIAVMEHLDRIDPAAELIGAVNTIVNDGGVLTGYCTDGTGFVLNLADHGVAVKGRHIAVAGAGGAATAIQIQCALDGAASVTILQRKGASFARAQDTADKIRRAVPGIGAEVIDLEDQSEVMRVLRSSDLFVNATSLGMHPNAHSTPVTDRGAFHSGLVVADAVYEPKETRLLREAAQAGCLTVGGKGMLLWQGAAAFKLFTGCGMPVEMVRERYFSD